VAILAACPVVARAENGTVAPQYGFTNDTDIGARGDLIWEWATTGAFGRGAGTYSAFSHAAIVKYTATDHLQVVPVLSLDSHRIRNVPGFNDRNRWSVSAVGLELKSRILDRSEAPIRLAVAALPYWRRIDAGSGDEVREFGSGFLIATEREIIPQRLFGSINVTYDLASARDRQTAQWARSSAFGISGALAVSVMPGVVASTELRYMRAYEGLGLDRLAGEALFAGPGISVALGETLQLGLAWNAQLTGRDAATGGRLDLTNFTRHQVLVKLEGEF